jgi:hypothetical protein
VPILIHISGSDVERHSTRRAAWAATHFSPRTSDPLLRRQILPSHVCVTQTWLGPSLGGDVCGWQTSSARALISTMFVPRKHSWRRSPGMMFAGGKHLRPAPVRRCLR